MLLSVGVSLCFCTHTVECWCSPETSPVQEELPWLSGKPAVQWPQPDRTSETQWSPSYSNGELM